MRQVLCVQGVWSPVYPCQPEHESGKFSTAFCVLLHHQWPHATSPCPYHQGQSVWFVVDVKLKQADHHDVNCRLSACCRNIECCTRVTLQTRPTELHKY